MTDKLKGEAAKGTWRKHQLSLGDNETDYQIWANGSLVAGEMDDSNNATFIVLSHSSLPALIEDWRRQRGEIKRMQIAIDAIYNHNEAARAAVIKHYGLHHNPEFYDKPNDSEIDYDRINDYLQGGSK